MGTLPGQVAFYYLAAASIASAVLAITRRNPVHSMLWVLALFLHVAGIFYSCGAEFLAAVQVIVYAGAILVFYLFFLMLLDLPSETAGPRFGAHWPLGRGRRSRPSPLLGVVRPGLDRQPTPRPDGELRRGALSRPIGTALFTDFALPFEIVSLVLLAAIVGAVVVARRKARGLMVPAGACPGTQRDSLRDWSDRLPQPAQHHPDARLRRDHAQCRQRQPGRLQPAPARPTRPDPGPLRHCRGGRRSRRSAWDWSSR